MSRIPSRALLATAFLFLASPAAFAGPDVAVQNRQIPLSDWLAAQTQTLVVFQAKSGPRPTDALGNLGLVDYANTRAQFLGLDYGYSAGGSVTVRSYPDGTGLVSVNLDFSNAIMWTFNVGGDLIFGFSPSALAGGANPAALANGHLQAKYTVADAAHPELDLVNVIFFGGGTTTQLKLNTSGQGTCHAALGVPEGTPGVCNIEQTGLFNTTGGGATADAFPAERVDVHPNGHAVTIDNMTSSGSSSAAGSTPVSQTLKTTWGRVKALYR
jgi:hypothetical protein